MHDIIIRAAVARDVPGISKVHVDTWRTTYKEILPEEILKALDYKVQEEKWNKRIFNKEKSDEFMYVALHSGEIVGFASGAYGEGSDIGIIFTIYVLESYQFKKIGFNLFTSIVNRLISKGIKEMTVSVFDKNPSKFFYEKMGGKPYKKQQVIIGGNNILEISYIWDDIL